MKKMTRRTKRLIAVLIVEVVIAVNVFATFAAEYDNKEDYDAAVVEAVEGEIAEDATKSEGTNGEKIYTWTDEEGDHEVVVAAEETSAEPTETSEVTKEGGTVTETYSPAVFDHYDEEGNAVYMTSKTETTSDEITTTTNENQGGKTVITHKITSSLNVDVYDADGNKITEIKADPKTGELPAGTKFYDEDGNDITDNVKTEKKVSDLVPVMVPVYDENGNEVLVPVKDKDGNIVYEECSADDTDALKKVKATTTPTKVKCDAGDEGAQKVEDSKRTVDAEEGEEGAYKVETGTTHKEDCDKDAEGAVEKSRETVDAEEGEEGAYLVSETKATSSIYSSDKDLEQLKALLGDYGITAQQIHIKESQTNYNVGEVVEATQQSGVHGEIIADNGQPGDNQGSTVRIEKIAEDVKDVHFKGNVAEVILGSEALKDKIVFNENTNGKVVIEDGSNMSVEDTRNAVKTLAEKILEKENAGKVVKLEEYTVDHQKSQLDFRDVVNKSDAEYDVVYANVSLNSNAYDELISKSRVEGTLKNEEQNNLYKYVEEYKKETGYTNLYYQETDDEKKAYVDFINSHNLGELKFIPAEYEHHDATNAYISNKNEDGSLFIYMNDNQIAVININTDGLGNDVEIDLSKYTVNVGDQSIDGTQGDGKLISQQLILNFGTFAGTIKTTGSIFGTVIAPMAKFVNYATSSGQLVANEVDIQSGEWHYTGTSVKTIVEKKYKKDIVSYEREVKDTKWVKDEYDYEKEVFDYIYEKPKYKTLETALLTLKCMTEVKKDKDPQEITWKSKDQKSVATPTTNVEYAWLVVTPSPEETPTPGTPDETPTPGTPDETPTPGTPDETPTPGTPGNPPGDNPPAEQPPVVYNPPVVAQVAPQQVLGARRTQGNGSVLGARRGVDKAVLGKRRAPSTGDSLAIFAWIAALAASLGGATACAVALKKTK